MSESALQRRLLGWALRVHPTAPPYGYAHGVDVVLTQTGSGLDLAVVDGIDALTQSLATAITTGLGTDVFNTAFGWDGVNVVTRDPGDGLIEHRLTIATINTLKSDPRVQTVSDVHVSRDAQDRADHTVTARFTTVLGATASLDLRGVINA